MLDVLKARWQTKGWHVMRKEDSEPMAIEFIKALERHQIPYAHYRELYDRSLDLRARRMGQGLSCDDFSADMMVARWPSLRAEIREREIAEGRTLTVTAPTQCLRCYGTGMEIIYGERGEKVGVKPGCMHEHIDKSDPSTAGIDNAIGALKIVFTEETAEDICKRVRQQLAHLVITTFGEESQRAWQASRTWAHAEKYVRENPE